MNKETNHFGYRLWRYEGEQGELIPLLQSAQDHFGYIPRHAIEYISSVTHIPEAQIYGVVTFYEQFRLAPMGKYVIRVCVGTACHVAEAKTIVDTLEDILAIEVGGTTQDGIFSLFTVSCLGCCSLAPVMMINGDTYGGVAPTKVRKIIKKIQREEKDESTAKVSTKENVLEKGA